MNTRAEIEQTLQDLRTENFIWDETRDEARDQREARKREGRMPALELTIFFQNGFA